MAFEINWGVKGDGVAVLSLPVAKEYERVIAQQIAKHAIQHAIWCGSRGEELEHMLYTTWGDET